MDETRIEQCDREWLLLRGGRVWDWFLDAGRVSRMPMEWNLENRVWERERIFRASMDERWGVCTRMDWVTKSGFWMLRRLMGSRGLCFEGWKTADESEFSMHGWKTDREKGNVFERKLFRCWKSWSFCAWIWCIFERKIYGKIDIYIM